MKKIIIALGIVGLVGAVLVVVALVKIGHAFHEAEGKAFYASLGAYTRIDEFAHASGKANYIAEADKNLAFIKSQLNQWQQTASGADLTALEKMQATAYQTTDRNIKAGQNPLAYLDPPNTSPQQATSNAPVSTNQ
jgi:hypothetical protein